MASARTSLDDNRRASERVAKELIRLQSAGDHSVPLRRAERKVVAGQPAFLSGVRPKHATKCNFNVYWRGATQHWPARLLSVLQRLSRPRTGLARRDCPPQTPCSVVALWCRGPAPGYRRSWRGRARAKAVRDYYR